MKLTAAVPTRIAPVHPNAGVRVAYERALVRLVDEMHAEVKAVLPRTYVTRMAMDALLTDGDVPGHEFHGNQWTGSMGEGEKEQRDERVSNAIDELRNYAKSSEGTLNERNIILNRETGEELGRFDQNLVLAEGELRYVQGPGSGFSNADVFMPGEGSRMWPDGTVLHMHTHPIDQTFSDGDMRVFMRGTIGEMRVVTASHEYTMIKTKEFTDKPSAERTPAHMQKVYDEHQEAIFQKHFDDPMPISEFTHMVIQKTIPSVCSAIGVRYSVRDIRGTAHDSALAMDRSIAAELKLLRKRWLKNFEHMSSTISEAFANNVLRHSDLAFSAALSKGGFSVPFKLTPKIESKVRGITRENVGLIKTIPSEYFADIRKATFESVQKGRDLAGLTEHLHNAYDITRRRAAFISRDQNNKATAAIHKLRQLECGITQAAWLHSGASLHPREEHEAFNNQVYNIEEGVDFDDGFGSVIPGEAYNCGCVSSSIIPGYDENEPEAATNQPEGEEA